MIIALTTLLIIFSGFSYLCYQHFRCEYHYTYLWVNNNDAKKIEKSRLLRFDYNSSQFFYRYIVNGMISDVDNNLSVDKVKEKFQKKSDYFMHYTTEFFVSLCQNNFETIKKETLSKIISHELDTALKDARLHDNSSPWITSNREILEYKKQLHLMMLKVFKETFCNNKQFIDAMNKELRECQENSIYDTKTAKKYKPGFFYSSNYNISAINSGTGRTRLPHDLEDLIKTMKKSDIYHCAIDLTGVYLDGLKVLIGKINNKKESDPRKITLQYTKEVQTNIELAIPDIFNVLYELSLCNNQHATFNFDIISILEFAATSGCSVESCKLIYDSLIAVVEDIKRIVYEPIIRQKFLSVEVLDVTHLMKLKIHSHTLIYHLKNRLKEYIKFNRSANRHSLANIKNFINFDGPSRWFFDGSLFDSLVCVGNDTFAASDVDTLFAFQNEKSRVIRNTCSECREKKADFCEKCEEFKNLFGYICLLYRYYKDLLERKSNLYFYQNMDDLAKYGKEDEKRELEMKEADEMKRKKLTHIEPQEPTNIGEQASSGIVPATKGREYRKRRPEDHQSKLKSENTIARKKHE